VPLRVRKNFTLCYDSSTNYSNSKIKLNGYYVNIEPFERPHYDLKTGEKKGSTLDTIYTNIMFFSDGLVIRGFNGLNCGNCDIFSNSQLLFDVSQNKKLETESFYNGFNWGIYTIEGDTIKLHILNHPPRFNPYWHLFEQWYLINNDGSLSPIYSKNLIDGRVSALASITRDTFKFIETNIILPSDTWLKKEEWFWCDKEKYRAWKKERKR
jgi:hypothetical protein